MLEVLGGLVILGIGVFLLIWLPLMLLAGLVKLVIFAVLLPFRLLGFVFAALTLVLGFVARGVFFVFAAVAGLIAVVAGLVMIPLIPILFLGLLVFLTARMFRPRRLVGATS